MAVPIISFPQSAFPFKTSTSAKSAAASLRSSKDSTVLAIANTFDTLTSSVNAIENLIRSCRVVDEAWFKVIGIGGTGYSNAPFLVDAAGNLTISGALISLISGTKSIVLDPSDASITSKDTAVAVDSKIRIEAGTLTVGPVTTATPRVQMRYYPAPISAASLQLITNPGYGEYATFEVDATSSGSAVFMWGDRPEGFLIRSFDNALGLPSFLDFRNGRGTVAVPAALNTGDTTLRILSEGYYSAMGYAEVAKILAVADVVAAGGITSSLRLFTNTIGVGSIERLTILGANTGINNASPGSILDVAGTTRITDQSTPVAGIGLELFYATRSQIRSYNRTTSAWKDLWIDADSLCLQTQASTGNVGVKDSSPTATLDVGGMIRATAFVAPADGAGTEISYTGGAGYINAYDRAGGAYMPLAINALNLSLCAGAGTGNVLVKTGSNNAAGGVLQINGDCTPDVDSGGSLGNAATQWTDLRLSGTPYIGAAPGITQVVALAQLTGGGATGSATFTKGILTAYSAPT